MQIRKRHKIRHLFWVPFWTLITAVCGMAGRIEGLLYFGWYWRLVAA